MKIQKFEEVLLDTEFVRNLLSLETGEEVKELLASRGIKITEDKMDRFSEILADELEKRIEMRKLTSVYESSAIERKYDNIKLGQNLRTSTINNI